jgi:hypothetical protein
LTANAKLDLVQPAYATSNKNDYGPTFGKVFAPADIYISAISNVNYNGAMDSRCNIGSMYKNSLFSHNGYSNQVNFCGSYFRNKRLLSILSYFRMIFIFD